jgi:energy-coupling factor transporter ATP-binding protein EcfA2
MLDEPTAGMNNSETERAVALIRKVTDGKTLVMVEHDLSVVFNLADRISVLVYGEIIASDVPERIRENAAVPEAYLGQAILHEGPVASGPRSSCLLRQESHLVSLPEKIAARRSKTAGVDSKL